MFKVGDRVIHKFFTHYVGTVVSPEQGSLYLVQWDGSDHNNAVTANMIAFAKKEGSDLREELFSDSFYDMTVPDHVECKHSPYIGITHTDPTCQHCGKWLSQTEMKAYLEKL